MNILTWMYSALVSDCCKWVPHFIERTYDGYEGTCGKCFKDAFFYEDESDEK